MAIFKQLKKVFVHIPRTGGTSVTKAIKDKLDTSNHVEDFKHYDINYYKRFLEYQDYEYFTIVRNPYSRIISYYNYHSNVDANVIKKLDGIENQKERFLYYLSLNLNDSPCKYDREKPLLVYKKQSDYINPEVKVLKFENIHEDINQYLKINIKLDKDRGYDLNKKYYNMDEIFSSETIKIINGYFNDDFKNFKYDIL